PALRKLGYDANEIDDIIRYCRGSGTLEDCPHINPETLTDRGFTADAIQRLEESLKTAFEIGFVFNQFTLGEEFCREQLGVTEKQLLSPTFNLLTHLGFTRQQINEANDYVCGTMTVEGAPHLREEHYAVFDCA